MPSDRGAHARPIDGRRAFRYSSASLVCLLLGQVTVVVLLNVVRLTEVQSNLGASALVAIPGFALNKYWVWEQVGRAHVRRELIPFWGFTLLGWLCSTVGVAAVADVGDPQTAFRTTVVIAASMAGFGSVWAVRFLYLDRIMFRPTPLPATPPTAGPR